MTRERTFSALWCYRNPNKAADEIERLMAELAEVHADHHECIDMLGKANAKLAEFGVGPLANQQSTQGK